MDNTTAGVGAIHKDEFTPISNDPNPVDYGQSPPLASKFGLEYFGSIFQTLKEDLRFTSVFVSIIGYVIIAALGHMSTTKDWLRYMLFLLFVLIIYKIMDINVHDLIAKKTTKLLLLIVCILSLIIILQNSESISILLYNLKYWFIKQEV